MVDKEKAKRHARELNDRILALMNEVNDLGIEIAYNGSLNGAPDWIDDVLTGLQDASDVLENNMDLDVTVVYGDLDEDSDSEKSSE